MTLQTSATRLLCVTLLKDSVIDTIVVLVRQDGWFLSCQYLNSSNFRIVIIAVCSAVLLLFGKRHTTCVVVCVIVDLTKRMGSKPM